MSFFKNLFNQFADSVRDSAQNPNPVNSPYHGGGGHSRDAHTETICHNPEHVSEWDSSEIHQFHQFCSGKECSWIVPFAGNAFVSDSNNCNNGRALPGNVITDSGVLNWNNSSTKVSLYFHCVQAGMFTVALRLRVPQGVSNITVGVNTCTSANQCLPQRSFQFNISEGPPNHSKCYQIVPCGEFQVMQPGYIKFDLFGGQKTGPVFADITHAILTPKDDISVSRHKRSIGFADPSEQSLEKSNLKFVANPDDFYFGRRGPSVHLNYHIPPSPNGQMDNVEYFYNEIYVPQGQDVEGAYFCAIGFSGGYFGIQVNSSTERRVLFSIWSAYSTDDPSAIPQDYKVSAIRTGARDIHVGEFGNEGSGAQSYLRYPWRSEYLYKFIVQCKPLDAYSTQISAWFCDSGNRHVNNWKLLASFHKPQVSTWLQGLYSFSENFIPEMGHVERHCYFGNQWVFTQSGMWLEVTKAKYTADDTAKRENRKDVAGGVITKGAEGIFFLRNCGFFSDAVSPGSEFCRNGTACPPCVDFSSLP